MLELIYQKDDAILSQEEQDKIRLSYVNLGMSDSMIDKQMAKHVKEPRDDTLYIPTAYVNEFSFFMEHCLSLYHEYFDWTGFKIKLEYIAGESLDIPTVINMIDFYQLYIKQKRAANAN